MTEYAKKIVEIQRIIQQSFLMIEEYNNPRTLLSRKRAGISLEFQLARTIDSLVAEITDLKKVEIPGDSQAELFLAEIALLEKSSERLIGLLNILNVTKSLRNMHGEEASTLIEKTEQEFNDLRQRYPFDKEDLEARSAHIVYCLFLAIVTDIQPFTPLAFEDSEPRKHCPKFTSHIKKQCFETETLARSLIDAPTSQLYSVGEIEQHDIISAEKYTKELVNNAGAHTWMPALKLEKCKISKRGREVLNCLVDLIALAPKDQENHGSISRSVVSRSVASIIQLFMIRGKPKELSSVDAAIFYNDCHFLIIELERAKFEHIYLLPNSTDSFNFGNLLNTVRKTARNVLIRYVIHIKTNYLTWSEKALENYLKNEDNQFREALSQLKRFADLWSDVCSNSVYAYVMFLVCSHVLSLLVNTLLKSTDFERSTCSKVLPLVKEMVELCSKYIRECESILKKKFTETKMGQSLAKKVEGLKVEMMTRGADRSLAELFDFKLDA